MVPLRPLDASLRFVLLTGVTKFSQITVFSGFNQPNDISMGSRYDAICGITEDELYSFFGEVISEMANKFDYTVDEMKSLLKKQYDGYHFSEALLDIYNPFSIINAFDKLKLDNYWYKSERANIFSEAFRRASCEYAKLTSRPYESQYFVDYRADAENPFGDALSERVPDD